LLQGHKSTLIQGKKKTFLALRNDNRFGTKSSGSKITVTASTEIRNRIGWCGLTGGIHAQLIEVFIDRFIDTEHIHT
jgi:hypothetical protein